MVKAQKQTTELNQALYSGLKLLACMATIGVTAIMPFVIASFLLGV